MRRATSRKIDGKPGSAVRTDRIRWLTPDSHVSMNMWGLTPDFMEYLEKRFCRLPQESSGREIKKGISAPTIIGS